MLELKDISKRYGKKVALHSFSYSFDKGIYALLGPNGAGKSTLMNITAGVIQRSGGQIFLNGKNIAKQNAQYKAAFGYMPQQQALINTFSPVQFLGYIAGLKGLSKREADEQIPALLKKVELFDNSREKIGGFSGGMKQRLLFSQSLLGSPEIVILDEPTVGLDPRQRVILRGVIEDYSKEHTVIISTHIVSDVESLAAEVIMLKNGRIIESGRCGEFLKRSGAPTLESLYMKLFDNGDENENDMV